MIKKIIIWLPLVLACLVSDSLFSSPLKSMNDSQDKTLSSEEGFFFGENSAEEEPTDLSVIPSEVSSDPKMMNRFAQDFLTDLLSGTSDNIAEYIRQHPVSVEDLPTPDELNTHRQEAINYKKAFSIYLSALTYLERKKASMTEDKFKERFNKKLFQYRDSVASVSFAPVHNQVMVTVILKEDPTIAYNFYVYDPLERISELGSEDSDALSKDVETLMEDVDTFVCKQHMDKLITVTTRLNKDNQLVALERSDYPTAFKDFLRFLKEYRNSIYEKPQWLVGAVSTFMQVVILLALKYSQAAEGSTLSSIIAESPVSLAITAAFAMLIGSHVGTYRNFIDKGHYIQRIAKDATIGLIFSYSLTIAEQGAGSLSWFSPIGLWHNVWVIFVVFTQKYLRYPITYITRMYNEFGYYGAKGEAALNLLGVKINRRALDNQLVYNGVNFLLKIMALLGFTVTVYGAQYNIGSYLFLLVPVVCFFVNGRWIQKEYKIMLKKYLEDPSEEHLVGLQRRTAAFKKYKRYVYTIKSAIFKGLGFFTGPMGLRLFKGRYDKDYANVPEVFNRETISGLTRGTISKLSISQLQDLIFECLDIIDESNGEIDEGVIDVLIDAKLVYANKRKSSHVLNDAIEQSKTISIPSMLNNGCALLFSTFI